MALLFLLHFARLSFSKGSCKLGISLALSQKAGVPSTSAGIDT